MSKIDLDPITSGYNLSKINANFQKIEDELNNKVLYRNSTAGEPNSMSSNLDMNSRSILNANKVSSNVLELGGVQVVPTNLVVDPYNGTREALRRSYAEAGYNLVDGSFEVGGTVTATTDLLLFEAGGKAYSYTGTLPHTVDADSSPSAYPGMWVGKSTSLLRSDLASSNAGAGGDLVYFKRKALATFVNSAQSMLDAQIVNIWEFADSIISKPITSDPNTWDWTPAFQAALNFIGHTELSPAVSGGCILIPPISKNSVYRITEIEVPIDVAILSYGATVAPVDQSQARTHLFKFMGMNKVAGLQISMDFSTTYREAIWCRGRNIDFTSCAVWFSANAVTIGDPLWLTNPTDGALGDSEISFSNCQFNWCLRTATAYGLNTIVTFGGGSRCYANRGSIPSGHPNYANWLAAPIGNFVSYGALIYIVGAFVGTFSRDVASLTARVMPVSAAGYINSYGKFFVSGTHIETSLLLYAPPEPSVSQDADSKGLVVNNCHGHIATSPADDYWISLSTQYKQGIDIRSCGFYGSSGVAPTRTKLISAPTAPVHATKDNFVNVVPGEFKDACVTTIPSDMSSIMLVNAFGANQTVTTSPATLLMPRNGSIDLHNSARGSYYTNTSGLFTAAVELGNVEITTILRYTTPSSTNEVAVELVVGGVVVDSTVLTGGYPRGEVKTRRIAKGSTFILRVTGSATYALDGSSGNKIFMIAST